MSSPERRLPARGALRLGAVVISHGWFQTAPFAWDRESQVLRRAEALPGGPAELALRQEGAAVALSASRELSEEDWAAAAGRARRMLQLDADLEGLDAAARAVEPALADELAGYGAGRLLAGASLYEDVVKTICGSNNTWRQAVASIGRIGALGPDGAFPAAPALLDAGEDWLRAQARVGYRAPYLLAAARAEAEGRLEGIEHEAHAGDGEAGGRALQTLPGVGPQSAGFLLLLLGHYGRPYADSATLRLTGRRWFGGARPTTAQVLERVAPAGPFAGLVLYWATVQAWHREAGLT